MSELRKTRSQRPAVNTYIPPQDIEAEQATLGSMLIEKQAIDTCRMILEVTDFYRNSHQSLYASILTLADAGEPVDLITIQGQLKTANILEEVGGVSYIATLYDRVPTAVNASYYAQRVKLHANQRKVIEAGMQLEAMARAAETDEDLDKAKDAIYKTLEGVQENIAPKPEKIGVISWQMYEERSERQLRRNDGEKVAAGIKTPFWQLNRLTGGLQRSDLIVIGARPSMGKSSLCMAIGLDVADAGGHVGVVSYEMGAEALTARALCSMADLEMLQIQREELLKSEDWQRWYEENKRLDAMNLSIIFDTSLTPSGIAAKCRQWVRQSGPLDLLIVDYLNLIPPDEKQSRKRFENRNIEVGETMKAIKRIASEQNCPVLLPCQLSRAVEMTDSKKAELHHLRDSGEVEADADLVFFPFRPAKYVDQATINNFEMQPVEIRIAKHRNGPLGTVTVGFIPAFGKWDNWEEPNNKLSLESTAPMIPVHDTGEDIIEGEWSQ